MGYPKIQYVDDSAAAQELQFQLPPVNKPWTHKTAVRHDVIASGGEKQSSLERVDQFIEIEMPAVFNDNIDPAITDVARWDQFMSWAIEGGEFEYFADSDIDSSITCTLEDTDWLPERKYFKTYGFKLTLRVAVA